MALKEITIKLPKMLANDISAKDIVGMVMDKAVTTSEYYRSRCKEFEQKYGMGFRPSKRRWNLQRQRTQQNGITCSYGKVLSLPILNGKTRARN